MKSYKLSKALAWQKVEKYDLVYFLELKSGNFFYFTETGAFIIEMVLNEENYISIIDKCLEIYEISADDLLNYLNDFFIELERMKIIETY
ncbi:PqqD family peptide modification chaperone [uncultured Anaerococcus sp.]|uniref:PqqD family peptide modification chaperone n=1 Tax=uncultured Anaerococcus sp. TaxID=293428 RepID=UPI002613A132|nr:PqqD family peptide modification chaperone [uncultured Anaerococcus sp.]